jgi:hypothetical protein
MATLPLKIVVFDLIRVVNYGVVLTSTKWLRKLVFSWNPLHQMLPSRMGKQNAQIELRVKWFVLSFILLVSGPNIGLLPYCMQYTLKTGYLTEQQIKYL